MKFKLTRLTANYLALILIASLVLFASVKPCPGEYCYLADVETKIRVVLTFIFWISSMGLYLKCRFFGEKLWAIRIGESLVFLFVSFVISLLVQHSVIRIHCSIAQTRDYKLLGSVTNSKPASRGSADFYFTALHTAEGDYDFFTRQKGKIGDGIALHLHRTSWGVVYGSQINQ